MTGGNDPDNRRSMEWNLATDTNDTLTLYKMLIHARTTYTALAEGSVTSLLVDNDIYAYGREIAAGNFISDAVVVLNRAGSIRRSPWMSVCLRDWNREKSFGDVLTGTTYAVSASHTLSLTVPATHGIILVNSTGDIDSDGDVDNDDFAFLAARWMNQYCIGPGWCDGCDLNKTEPLILKICQWAQNWLLNRTP